MNDFIPFPRCHSHGQDLSPAERFDLSNIFPRLAESYRGPWARLDLQAGDASCISLDEVERATELTFIPAPSVGQRTN